jgi:hypothetical protein
MKLLCATICGFVCAMFAARAVNPPAPTLLKADDFRHYIETFNQHDNDLYSEVQYVKNAGAWDFLKDRIPLFECPDNDIEQTYYFRWWTYRKHITQTPDGFIITEFLPPVPWAGKDNSINCAAGFHITEGRWLHESKYLDDYLVFWLRKGGAVRQYSFWIADATWERYLVTGDAGFTKGLLPDLVANYQSWEKKHLDPNGLFWQDCEFDGMEMSAGGSGYRPTINSYMYGDALALAEIAALTGDTTTSGIYRDKAAALKAKVQANLWDTPGHFFKTLPRPQPNAPVPKLVEQRELAGYTPWYFNLPDADYISAWSEIRDPKGFNARFGLTTCEQGSPGFAVDYSGHECQWNGPVWPYATSITLTAMANVINSHPHDGRFSIIFNNLKVVLPTSALRSDYFNALSTYAMAQHRTREDGVRLPWIDEVLNPFNGDWISRTILLGKKHQPIERGKDYDHSMYVDHVITGLVGLRPRADNIVEVNPLVPEGKWNYFCLDNILYHGHTLTIFYDKTGKRYGKGTGLHVLADGREIARSPLLARLTGRLP